MYRRIGIFTVMTVANEPIFCFMGDGQLLPAGGVCLRGCSRVEAVIDLIVSVC